MRIDIGIEMLEVTATIMGQPNTIHPTLIWDENTAILVDAGYPGQLSLIQEAVERAGVPFSSINKVILTHQDIDHIGSLSSIIEGSEHPIEVMASEIEQPYIQGDKLLIKYTPENIEKAVSSLPPQVSQMMRERFRAVLENPPRAEVNRIIGEKDSLPCAGGLIVIDTPGHTPGHISLYHPSSKTLIAGDALMIINGELQPSNPQYTIDMSQALQSVKKLMQYDIDTVICYHGGVMRDNVNTCIAALAQSVG